MTISSRHAIAAESRIDTQHPGWDRNERNAARNDRADGHIEVSLVYARYIPLRIEDVADPSALLVAEFGAGIDGGVRTDIGIDALALDPLSRLTRGRGAAVLRGVPQRRAAGLGRIAVCACRAGLDSALDPAPAAGRGS
jgi:hypothetical protein